jgi:hypothetical protein
MSNNTCASSVHYKDSMEVNEIAQCIIADKINWGATKPRIKFLVKVAKGSKYLGKCCRATGQWKYLTNYDYVIEVWEKYWKLADDNQKEALLYHELLHVLPYPKKDGTISWLLRRHDLEEFFEVARDHGAWEEGVVEFSRCLREHKLAEVAKMIKNQK